MHILSLRGYYYFNTNPENYLFIDGNRLSHDYGFRETAGDAISTINVELTVDFQLNLISIQHVDGPSHYVP